MLTQRILLIALLLILATACVVPAATAAVKQIGQPNVEVGFPLQLGWYGGQQAWYVCFGSNDIDWVKCLTQFLPIQQAFAAPVQLILRILTDSSYALYPKLGSALAGGAPPVYIVTNFQQGPVFTAVPGQTDYSGLWHVFLVTWNEGVTPRPICDAEELPGPEEVTILPIDVIIDAPIIATGPLTPPAQPSAGLYRIPQLQNAMLQGPQKIIFLPAWPAYAADEVTKRPVLVFLVITDAGDPSLAAHLKANYAPALNDVDDANTQKVWYFRKGQVPPVPPGQNLILEHTVLFNPALHTYFWWQPLNLNFQASPVMDLQSVVRGTIPPYVTVNNPSLVQRMLSNGCLLPSGPPMRINTFLVPFQFDMDGVDPD